jgi:hypothetical protein
MPVRELFEVSAGGYADTRPEGSNDSEEGRMQNRRIEIVLYPKGPDGNRGADGTGGRDRKIAVHFGGGA